MPFVAIRAAPPAATFNLWGQPRFLPNGVADVARIQWRPLDNSAAWATVGAPVAIDQLGYYTATRAAPSNVPNGWRLTQRHRSGV
jgi:hypothetical protein